MAEAAQLFYCREATVTTMSKRLQTLAVMWRVCGCFHIPNIKAHGLNQARVQWKSFYTLYSLLCASILVSFSIMQISTASQSIPKAQGIVSDPLLVFMRSVISLETVVVFVVMATKSGAILKFFRNAQSFEASMEVPPFHRACQQWAIPCVCNALLFASMVSYTYYRTVAPLIAAYHQMTTPDVLVVLYTLIANALYMACDYGNKATARAVCDVLTDYVRVQVDVLAQKQKSGLTAGDLEKLSMNMTAIQAIKEEINAALNPCIVLFCLRAFCVVSIDGYTLICLGFHHETSFLILFYCLQVAFGLLDLALVSHTLENETENVKLSLADAIMTETSAAYISQIRFVYKTIEPRQMCLSAGGFFAINARTLMHASTALNVLLIENFHSSSSSNNSRKELSLYKYPRPFRYFKARSKQPYLSSRSRSESEADAVH